MEDILTKASRLLSLRNYSPITRKAYLFYIKEYVCFAAKINCHDKQKAIETYLLAKHKRGQSPQTINLALNAIKYLYAQVLKEIRDYP